MLKSNRIELAPLSSSDIEIFFKWINSREEVLYNAAYNPISETKHHAWFESIQEREDVRIFGIRLLENNRLIGSCQLNHINFIHRNAELQIRIGEVTERGKSYGTEAVKLLLKFGFHDLNLHRIYLTVFADNKAALRAYEKSGFSQEGLMRQAAHIDGKYKDLVVLGILRDEFEKE